MTEQLSSDELAQELKRLVSQLQAEGRRDLLLRAIGVPLLEELRIEAARCKLSRLVITKDFRFLLADYNQEVELQPVHKAVYLLFLAHPEGIEFKHLADHRAELTRYYMATAKLMDKEKIAEGVDHLINPLDNAINEKCSRIKLAFTREFDESLARNYYITGERGEAKKILLPRDLVTWEMPD